MFRRKPPVIVATDEQVQQAVREEVRGLATLMLDIRRGKLSSVSDQYLRLLGISPLDHLGLEVEEIKFKRLASPKDVVKLKEFDGGCGWRYESEATLGTKITTARNIEK